MRIVRSLGSPMVVAALCAIACGASAPPAASPPEVASADVPTPEATVSALDARPAGSDAEGWAGDDKKNTSADGATSDAPASAQPASDEPAGAKRPETRTMDVIRQRVMDNRKAARKCYEDARKDSKDLQGNLVIHFVLDPEGKVKSADLNQERSTLKAPEVVDCVIGVIKAIQFPKSSRAMETTANYPFNFTP